MRGYIIARLQSSPFRCTSQRIDASTSVISSVHRFLFSTTATKHAEQPTSSPRAPFTYPKAEDLFNRITQQLSADEVRLMTKMTLDMLGRPMSENEFYWRGIGGKRSRGGGKKGSSGAATDTEEEVKASAKTSFDVKMVSFDSKAKIKIIKEIRAITDLGLKEAKELVDSVPSTIKKDLNKDQAEELKKKLEELGAKVEIE